jgi:hypothetical protein
MMLVIIFSFIVLATVITITNCDHTVIMIAIYDRKTFKAKSTGLAEPLKYLNVSFKGLGSQPDWQTLEKVSKKPAIDNTLAYFAAEPVMKKKSCVNLIL